MFHNESNLAATVAELIERCAVEVDERPLGCAPSADEIESILAPLLEWCDTRRPTAGRGIVGIVGPAGAGKTHALAWLAATAKALDLKGFAFLSMDAYHHSNLILDSRAGTTIDGQLVPLRKLKGVPLSYAGEALCDDLRQLKTRRNTAWLPVYSRELHEPREHALRVGPEVDWIFIEGNFLFLPADPWGQICKLFDRRIFIDIDETTVRRQLTDRHARSGRDVSKFDEHYRIVDEPNNRLIRSTKNRADAVWTRSAGGKLVQVGSEQDVVHECR